MSRSPRSATTTMGRRQGPRIVFRSLASQSGEPESGRELSDGLHAVARLHHQHQGDHSEADRHYRHDDDQQRLACGVGADYQCYPRSRHCSPVCFEPIFRSITNIRSIRPGEQESARKKHKISTLFSENKVLYSFAEQKRNYVLPARRPKAAALVRVGRTRNPNTLGRPSDYGDNLPLNAWAVALVISLVIEFRIRPVWIRRDESD